MLVVDDNATNRRILRGDAGELAHEADDGRATSNRRWRRCGRQRHDQPFACVISDCQMPEVDGFMLARRDQARERLQATPIVMLTSVGQPDDQVQRCRNGIDAFLTKPVKHSDLLEALARSFGVSTQRAAARQVTPDRRSESALAARVASCTCWSPKTIPSIASS